MARKAGSGRKAVGRGAATASKAAKKAAGKKAAGKSAGAKKKAAGNRGSGNRKGGLTKTELKRYRQMLLEKRRELVGDMTGIQAEALGTDRQESKGDISDHPADAGTDNFEQEFSLGLLESERALLEEIDEALGRIEEGTYGICQGTGKPISKARLTARPWAKYSIEYARMVEKGLVQAGERVCDDDDDE